MPPLPALPRSTALARAMRAYAFRSDATDQQVGRWGTTGSRLRRRRNNPNVSVQMRHQPGTGTIQEESVRNKVQYNNPIHNKYNPGPN